MALEIAVVVLTIDTQSAVAKLRALRELGVRAVVYGLGTAYSSLPHPGRFPVECPNAERSLVSRLGVNPRMGRSCRRL